MSDFAVDTSLKERLARRREELRRDRVIDIPVPGYEKELVARYVPLDYHVLRRIGKRAELENQKDEIQSEIDLAADTIVNACEGIYSKDDNGGLVPTGYKWGTKAAVELFGVEAHELTSRTAREAVLAVFPSDTLLVLHYAEYSRRSSTAQDDVEAELQGESRAS